MRHTFYTRACQVCTALEMVAVTFAGVAIFGLMLILA